MLWNYTRTSSLLNCSTSNNFEFYSGVVVIDLGGGQNPAGFLSTRSN